MTKQIVTVRCPECGSTDLIVDSEMGEYVCGRCGLVIEENIPSQEAEWRAFTPQERDARARAGTPTDYSHYDKGLSTVIRVEKDAFGRPLSPKVKQQMWRLKRWHTRSKVHASQSRNLMLAMSELQRLSDILHMPSSVHDMAAIIYRKTLNEGLVRGRSIGGMVAGALYAAVRFTKLPRTLKEIAEASQRTQKEIARSYGVIVRNLDMRMPIDDPADYITKVAEKAKVSSEVEGLAIKLLREAKKKYATTGKDPSGLAAAILYLSARMLKEKVTQARLAKAANVTEVTVRNRKRDLMKSLNLKKI
ncbi:MAG: transcription initiation factor IIB [Candidatus Bathyarchaeota archaeon]|nr:transcription initiation factor IIB [Candidatus Bathyarchaeota archaeon]